MPYLTISMRCMRCPGDVHPRSGSFTLGTSQAMLSAPTARACLCANQYEALAAIPGEIPLWLVPEAGIPGTHQRHVAGLDAHALPLAALLQILVGYGVAGLLGIYTPGGRVQQHTRGDDEWYFLDAELLEATRALDLSVQEMPP